jgi:SAM-dependent methyltransferase
LGHSEILREEFNRWVEVGRGEGMEQEHLPITLPVLEKMRLAATDNVLDAGCGSGWLTRRLAKRVTEGRVVGMDVSDEMIRVARRTSLDFENILYATGRGWGDSVGSEFFQPRDFGGVCVLLAGACGGDTGNFPGAAAGRGGVDFDQLIPRQSTLPPVGAVAGRADASVARGGMGGTFSRGWI